MHRIALPIAQPRADFNLSRPVTDRHPILQLAPPVMASIAFSITLTAMPEVLVKLAASTLVGS